MAKTYKIHPSIGFARLGTSPETFTGPELPGTFMLPPGETYRDGRGRLKRQAARFWVFEYDDTTGAVTPVCPGTNGVAKIVWNVHLKNKKAVWYTFQGTAGEGPGGYSPTHPLRNASVTVDREKRLVINPGLRTLEATGADASHEISKGTSANPAQETWPGPLNGGAKSIESLGTMFVDSQGRLSVAGGFGVSGTTGALPGNGALAFDNNDGWFDDVSDGPVTARVVFEDGASPSINAASAWLAVGPPDYAPPVQNMVTVYDLLFDLGLRFFNTDASIFAGGNFQTSFHPSFTEHIYPILRRALDYQWVIAEADAHPASGRFNFSTLAAPRAPGETPTTNPRNRIFQRIRNPDALTASGRRTMPRLHNDGVDGAPPQTMRFSVTRFQYFALSQWAAGDFDSDWTGPPAAPTTVTAPGLDRAALEAAAGGAFFPGMEVGWILRDPRVYVSPFEYRFRDLPAEGVNGLSAGDATKRMAIPWQADFLKCGQNWWPAQRPNQVFVGGAPDEWDRGVTNHVQLTDVWSQLGILAPDPADNTRYIETERML